MHGLTSFSVLRSLTARLVLAFVAVCLVEALLVGEFVRRSTYTAFQMYVTDEAVTRFTGDALSYYQRTGTWHGVERYFREQVARRPRPRHRPDRSPPGSPPPRPGMGATPTPRPAPRPEAGPPGSRPPRRAPHRFGLVDMEGVVVKSNGDHRMGTQLPAAALAHLAPVLLPDSTPVAQVLMPAEQLPPDAPEARYLQQTNRAIGYAMLVGMGVALVLAVLVARRTTQPVRTLTKATQALARGQLGQEVPIRTHDELGTLTKAFNQMSTDLAQAHALREQMTADIAHDLRSPLTVLSGYLEALRDGDLAPTPERFATLYAEVQHLNRLVEDLRTLSLADAGTLSLQRRALDPRGLLEQVRAAFAPQAAARAITLVLEAHRPLPSVTADPDRLAQVLGNLVSNALRHTPQGGQITLGAQKRPSQLELSVADTGTGIAPEALPHLFDRFYRTDRARRRDAGGSGLGLAIAKSLVEAHGGTIRVSSTLGIGTTFTLRLPLQAGAPPT